MFLDQRHFSILGLFERRNGVINHALPKPRLGRRGLPTGDGFELSEWGTGLCSTEGGRVVG